MKRGKPPLFRRLDVNLCICEGEQSKRPKRPPALRALLAGWTRLPGQLLALQLVIACPLLMLDGYRNAAPAETMKEALFRAHAVNPARCGKA